MTLGTLSASYPAMFSQTVQAKLNDCGDENTFCWTGGQGSKGGGFGGQSSFDSDSGEVLRKGGGGPGIGGGQLQGNIQTFDFTKCTGEEYKDAC